MDRDGLRSFVKEAVRIKFTINIANAMNVKNAKKFILPLSSQISIHTDIFVFVGFECRF